MAFAQIEVRLYAESIERCAGAPQPLEQLEQEVR